MKDGTFLLALDTNAMPRKVVGTIGVEPVNQETAKLTLLCVHENYRGTGIGRRLLTEAIRFSKEAKFKKVRYNILDIGLNRSVADMVERRNFRYVTWYFLPTNYLPLLVRKVFEKRLV